MNNATVKLTQLLFTQFIELPSWIYISNSCIQYLNLHQLSPPVAWCWSRWTVYLKATDLFVTSLVVADLPGESVRISLKSIYMRGKFESHGCLTT